MKLINFIIIIFTKIIYVLIKHIFKRAGSTWPGEIALRLNPNFLKNIYAKTQIKIIVVAGTNGKTTTATQITSVLQKQGLKVFQNEEGANLLNGIAAATIRKMNWLGILHADVAVFEIDENALPQLLNSVTPTTIILLNLFRDQLDRYGELDTIALRWKKSLQRLPETTILIINADDPLINSLSIGTKSKVYRYGLPTHLMLGKTLTHDADSSFCPVCGNRLEYLTIAFSHLGDYKCQSCGFIRGVLETYEHTKLSYPMMGLYNISNSNGVALLLEKTFGLSVSKINEALINFKPVFGRQEKIIYKNREWMILLSKNPAGFNQTIDAVHELKKDSIVNILLILNDRIPDGRDVSWIWDTEIEELLPIAKNIFVTGDRTYDMALRIKYADGANKLSIEPNMLKIIENIRENSFDGETIYVLATYSGMLEIRKILTGRKLM